MLIYYCCHQSIYLSISAFFDVLFNYLPIQIAIVTSRSRRHPNLKQKLNTKMRVVLQRVARAKVEVGGRVVGSIEKGLCLLVGIHASDVEEDMDFLVKKILNLRLWGDESDGSKWKKSVTDLDLEILAISQFTLFGNVMKGSKPSFNESMKSEFSRPFFDAFVQKLRDARGVDKVQTGAFGEYMQVELVNDGPVTLEIDSRKFDYK